jgi:hypothetical protein
MTPVGWTPRDEAQKRHFAFGLTESEVRRLQGILQRECHVELTLEQAWARSIDLLALAMLLVDVASKSSGEGGVRTSLRWPLDAEPALPNS